MELEVKKGDVVNPRDEQKKLVIELAKRVAAQRVGDNLDVITDKIDRKLTRIADKKSDAEADAAELERACENARGIVRDTLQAGFEAASAEVAGLEELLENSRGDVLAAYTDRIAKAYLDAMAKVINAARRELRDNLQSSAGTIAKSIRRTETLQEDVNTTIKHLN